MIWINQQIELKYNRLKNVSIAKLFKNVHIVLTSKLNFNKIKKNVSNIFVSFDSNSTTTIIDTF